MLKFVGEFARSCENRIHSRHAVFDTWNFKYPPNLSV